MCKVFRYTCRILFFVFSLALIYLSLCAIFRVDYFNVTVLTHGIPNTMYFIEYTTSGRNTSQFALPNGVESIADRIGNDPIFIPPKQFIEMESKSFDMNPNTLHKFDSVPFMLRDVALPRASSTEKSPTTGTSVFVTNLEDRGVDNKMKRKYMAGLTQAYVDRYVELCTPSMHTAMETLVTSDAIVHDVILNAVKNMTFLIHTELPPEQEDADFIDTGIAGFNSVSKISDLFESLFMPAAIQKHVLKHDAYIERLENKLNDEIYRGLFKSLKDNGYRSSDIMVEYLHNIFALTMQWTTLMEHLLEEGIQSDAKAIYEHLRKNPVATFVISSKDKDGTLPKDVDETTHVLHTLKSIMQGSHTAGDFTKCPALKGKLTSTTVDNAVIANGTQILEQDYFWAFGRSYRRCAGEVLTIDMMKRWSSIYTKYNYDYTRGKTKQIFGLGYKYNSTIQSDTI